MIGIIIMLQARDIWEDDEDKNSCSSFSLTSFETVANIGNFPTHHMHACIEVKLKKKKKMKVTVPTPRRRIA